MKLYSSNENYKLYQGNMLDILQVITPESIDSIITDPPYGLTSITKRFGKEDSAECQYGKDGSFQRLSKGFMGKEWDGSGIEYNIETWKKCYEVLKPGGYLLAFGGSRTFHRIACAIEDAGFEIRDTICWMYGMGFPKSMNIGKALEKRWNKNGENNRKQISEDRKALCEHEMRLLWKRNIQKSKSDENQQNEVLQSSVQEQGLQISKHSTSDVWREEPSLEGWNNIQKTKGELQRCKVCEVSNRVFINGEERWICNGTQVGDGKTIREMLEKSGSCASYRPQPKQQQDRELNVIQEQCRTQESREVIEYWNKFGTALKPSFEPIIVARKPFKGSLVDNVIEYGVGGINIDECRVGNEERQNPQAGFIRRGRTDEEVFLGTDKNRPKGTLTVNGRFPANTILTYDETDFDEVCGGFPDTKGGTRHNTAIRKSDKNSGYGFDLNTRNEFNDSGSASRYFYCAKASKKDRDEGLDEFEEVDTTELLNRKANTAGILWEQGGTNAFSGAGGIKKNTHPTVKPTELMQYLVRLVSPEGATILDPFNGSGSTGKAVMYENKERNKNYKYIGIELTEEYLPIAKARIEYVCNLIEDDKKQDKQLSIFDIEGE